MRDDYLWDRSGPPDPEVERLEDLLAPLRYRPERRFRAPLRKLPVAAGIAAAVSLLAGAVWFAYRPHGPSWQVVAVEGLARQQRVSRGGTVETGAASRLRLELDTFGHVDVEPNTKLKLLVTKQDEQRMDMPYGKIHAQIWAPPHQFYVHTPSAVTVDLGCEYTLQVDKAGDSTVKVDFGWVAFEDQGKESFIPAHAVCVTRPGKGPGIPYYEDAGAGLRSAVERFDSTGDATAAGAILADARPRDAITVWHLLRRVPAQERGAVYDRLAELIRVPAGVSRARVLAGDRQATDALWDALGLGDVEWWRQWKR